MTSRGHVSHHRRALRRATLVQVLGAPALPFALEACAQACKLCRDECEQHASHHEHCRVCAEACRCCEEACNSVLSGLAA